MPKGFGNKLVVAISSRALFNLDASHAIYEQQGLENLRRAIRWKTKTSHWSPVMPFPLVQKLLGINALLGGEPTGGGDPAVAQYSGYRPAGVQLHPALSNCQFVRAAFCGGHSPYPVCQCVWLPPVPLNGSGRRAPCALENGLAAATLLPSSSQQRDTPEIRFAFDGDAVLFSDEAERIYKTSGLDAFAASEQAAATGAAEWRPFQALSAGATRLAGRIYRR
jgi:5'-nucleotidase